MSKSLEGLKLLHEISSWSSFLSIVSHRSSKKPEKKSLRTTGKTLLRTPLCRETLRRTSLSFLPCPGLDRTELPHFSSGVCRKFDAFPVLVIVAGKGALSGWTLSVMLRDMNHSRAHLLINGRWVHVLTWSQSSWRRPWKGSAWN